MFKLRTRPFGPHQEEAIAWVAERERGALLLPMGTGKTYIALAWMSLQSGTTIVVAPLSVLRSWEKQIRDHTTASVSTATGTRQDRIAALRSSVDIVLVNYDFFSRLHDRDVDLFSNFRGVVLDESTRIKNPKAKRTANIIRVFRRTRRKLILTGNPVPKGYEDLFSQWLFLDGGQCLGANYFHFLRRYFNPIEFGEGKRGWTISAKGPSQIANRIAGSYFHRKKEDCVDLPDKIFERKYYTLGGDARQFYRHLVREWLAETRSGERIVNNALSRDIALRQVCSGFMGDGNGNIMEQFDSRKYDTLIEALEEIGAEDQVVIWFWFREEGRKLYEQIWTHIDEEPAIIHGGVDDQDRREVLQSFEEGRTRIVLAQLQTCAYGINEFAKCRYVIYFGHTYDYDLRAQSEDRTSRIGSTSSCTYIDIVAEKSIEEAILEVLAKKQQISESMFKQEVVAIIEGWRI